MEEASRVEPWVLADPIMFAPLGFSAVGTGQKGRIYRGRLDRCWNSSMTNMGKSKNGCFYWEGVSWLI
jgi:hypothetical protein